MTYTRDQLSSILDEIAAFEVELAEDPTLPSLGSKYLQGRIAQCRKYTNRVMYYVQTIGKQVKDLSVRLKVAELDLELKSAKMLADDPVVKKQPSIEDRKALVTTFLKDEHDEVVALKVDLLDATETLKIVKMKHQDLTRTNADIKAQRQIVKDDIDARIGGGGGYDKPQTKQDRSVPDGMPPPVVPEKIDPRDLLDPEKRPEDLPEPVDEMHAQQIADFFGHFGQALVQAQTPSSPFHVENVVDESDVSESTPKTEYDDNGVSAVKTASFDDF